MDGYSLSSSSQKPPRFGSGEEERQCQKSRLAITSRSKSALKRFNRKIQQDGVLAEARRRRHYEAPSAKRKRKAEARKRKARKG